MSVTVGFSQATTSLIVPAPGTTKPDGTPADGGAEGGGEAGLFAALLAMLAPGAQPTPDADTAPTTADTPAAIAPSTIVPPAEQPPVAVAPETPVLTDLQKSEQGKALLKEFADALKAARSALDDGKPLDPALEKQLRETVDAIAAWFAGQPQVQSALPDTARLAELAAGTNFLPTPPSGDLPEVPAPADAALPTSDETAPAASGEVVPKVMQAQPVPAQLAELGSVLKDFAAQLEKTSPDLAKALSALADRMSVGDISDEAMAQLGLTRSPGSTSPELEQLVAALAPKPETRAATAAPALPIATPVLDATELLASQSAAAAASPEAKAAARTVEDPQPESARPREARLEEVTENKKPRPLARTANVELDTEAGLDVAAGAKPKDDSVATDSRPVSPYAPRPDTPAPASPASAAADASAQTAQASQVAAVAASTATRAIHAAYAAPVQQLNYPQVAFEVARQFEAGNTRFQIRLDPADLGRIDVKLDLDKSGTVSAHMFVERPETLDLMMRDQRALQQALQQAGLDASKTSLEFSLRQNPFAGGDTGQGSSNGGHPGFGPFGAPAPDESSELAAQTLYRGSASASGVNLFV